MKKLLFTLGLVWSMSLVHAQNCCSKPGSTEMFAMFTSDQNFVSAHLDPIPFELNNKIGNDISFKTPDGKEGYAYEIKAKTSSNLYVFVVHEWWGLNDYIKQEAERIYNTLGNVNVIALDLYDRKIATVKDSAAKYMMAVKTERAQAIIQGALNRAGKKAKIATIGWCFGGGWSLQSSLLAGKQSKACVMFYGMPEEKTEKLKKLNAPVLFVWPDQDQWINKEVVQGFESRMKELKKSLSVLTYNADHAFANPSNPKYNKEFSEDAYGKAINFIRENLK